MNTTARICLLLCLALATTLPACRCASGEGGGDDDDSTEEGGGDGDEGGDGEGSGDAWEEGDLEAQMPEDGEPQRGGEVVVQLYSEPPSLNTIVDSDWWAARITEHHIYESLVGMNPYDHPNYGYVPELAESWEVSDDHLTYTFHLREGVTWHDGEAFTSEDVIATFEKVQDEDTKAVHLRSYLEELDGVEAPDEHTVVFTWKRPYFLALDDPFTSFPIQPAHVIAEMSGTDYNEAASNPLNRHPVGTGPFEFVEWESNQKIVMRRNDDYWGDEPHLDRVVFRIVKEAAVGLQLAERGELDFVTRITPEQWSSMDSESLQQSYYRSRFFDANYAWIGWNAERPFFSDTRVRRAMTMLTNREGIIEQLFHGVPRPTNCHFYFPTPQCQGLPDPLPYDPPRAVELLEEAGWTDSNDDGVRDKDGVEFEFTFMIPASSEDAGRMGTMMKEDLGRAGVELNLQRVEWSAFTRRLREHEFDACTLLWGNSSPRTDPTQIWHSSSIDGGSNYISFRHERADELMEQARVTFDEEERAQIYREFGEILIEEQPYTFLYVRPRLSLIHERVHGARESLMFWQWDDVWVTEERGAE